MEQWDAWLANDLEGAQTVIRCACAASEPALAEELVVKAGFSCGAADELAGVRAQRVHVIEFPTTQRCVSPLVATALNAVVFLEQAHSAGGEGV